LTNPSPDFPELVKWASPNSPGHFTPFIPTPKILHPGNSPVHSTCQFAFGQLSVIARGLLVLKKNSSHLLRVGAFFLILSHRPIIPDALTLTPIFSASLRTRWLQMMKGVRKFCLESVKRAAFSGECTLNGLQACTNQPG